MAELFVRAHQRRDSQLKEDWKDKKPEDYTEQEQRRLRKLRKRAGTNQATFA
ncbi:MAG: hypothetical protein WBM40_16035 [Thiohalocapsa sp.]